MNFPPCISKPCEPENISDELDDVATVEILEEAMGNDPGPCWLAAVICANACRGCAVLIPSFDREIFLMGNFLGFPQARSYQLPSRWLFGNFLLECQRVLESVVYC